MDWKREHLDLKIVLLFAVLCACILGWAILNGSRDAVLSDRTEANYYARKYAQIADIETRDRCDSLAVPQRAACEYRAKGRARDQQRQEYELEAQRRAATWNAAMGEAAIIGMFVSIVGVALVFATFAETRRTARAAIDSAKHAADSADEMRKANALTEKNAERQLRPYLWPEAAWFEIMENGEPLSHVHLKNYGETPALNVRGWTHTWIGDFPLKGPLPEPGEGEVEMASAILPKGQHSEARQPHGTVPNEYSLNMIKAEKAALYLYGYGTYVDVFGNAHFYRYIYFSFGKKYDRGRFGHYTSGNVIDVQ